MCKVCPHGKFEHTSCQLCVVNLHTFENSGVPFRWCVMHELSRLCLSCGKVSIFKLSTETVVQSLNHSYFTNPGQELRSYSCVLPSISCTRLETVLSPVFCLMICSCSSLYFWKPLEYLQIFLGIPDTVTDTGVICHDSPWHIVKLWWVIRPFSLDCYTEVICLFMIGFFIQPRDTLEQINYA